MQSIPRAAASVALAGLLSMSTVGCSLFGSGKPDPVPSRQRVFFAPFDEVERAMKQAMTRYPQKIDNPDAGIYETDWVKGDLRFKGAHQKEDYSDGYRYRLQVRLVRGESAAKPAIKVVIIKETVIQKDYFAAEKPVPSDGLEELIILYRISRELSLEKALRRAQEKANKKSAEGEEK